MSRVHAVSHTENKDPSNNNLPLASTVVLANQLVSQTDNETATQVDQMLVTGVTDDDGWQQDLAQLKSYIDEINSLPATDARRAMLIGRVFTFCTMTIMNDYTQNATNQLGPIKDAVNGGSQIQELLAKMSNIISTIFSQWNKTTWNSKGQADESALIALSKDPAVKQAIQQFTNCVSALSLLMARYKNTLFDDSSSQSFQSALDTFNKYVNNGTSQPYKDGKPMSGDSVLTTLRIFSTVINGAKPSPKDENPKDLSQYSAAEWSNAMTSASNIASASSNKVTNILNEQTGQIQQDYKSMQDNVQSILDMLKTVQSNIGRS